ncbi:hypothetical protein RFI_21790, partial [Reticulomyxa filosa]
NKNLEKIKNYVSKQNEFFLGVAIIKLGMMHTPLPLTKHNATACTMTKHNNGVQYTQCKLLQDNRIRTKETALIIVPSFIECSTVLYATSSIPTVAIKWKVEDKVEVIEKYQLEMLSPSDEDEKNGEL